MDNSTRIHKASMLDYTSKKEIYNIWSKTCEIVAIYHRYMKKFKKLKLHKIYFIYSHSKDDFNLNKTYE